MQHMLQCSTTFDKSQTPSGSYTTSESTLWALICTTDNCLDVLLQEDFLADVRRAVAMESSGKIQDAFL